MSITKSLLNIKLELPKTVTLVAVSKTKPIVAIQEAYNCGHRIFGENKVQEMVQKWEEMPKDIQWHMIGHVQTNKVKYMAPFVSLIHGVDSFKLLIEINKQAVNNNRVITCLLQMHIAQESTKFGLNKEELDEIITSKEFISLKNIKVIGLMGMATFTTNEDQVKKEFSTLKSVFDQLKIIEKDNFQLKTLSMGMSGDYKIAIEAGSTMVRIGSSIFGNRNYS